MSELSNALGGSGPKHEISCAGKTYPMMYVTQAVKDAYGKALYRRAREALTLIRNEVDKDFYESRMGALVDRYTDGQFAIESEYGKRSLEKPGGSILLLSIMLGTKNGPDIIPMSELEVVNIVSQAPEEVKAVFKTVIAESFPGVDVDKLVKDVEGTQGVSVVQDATCPKAPSPRPSSSG